MPATAPRCPCCNLQHNETGPKGLCWTCSYHQSPEIEQTAKRHREHEEMLRKRLEAAREWAATADAERKAFGDKMHWAYKSRDRTIAVLRKISDMHELRSDLSCKCGLKKNCRVAQALDDRGVQALIRNVDNFEDDQRRREQLMREVQRDPYAWEDYMRGASPEEALGWRPREDDTA